MGRIADRQAVGDGCRMAIAYPSDLKPPLALGDSISINGVCSTVVRRDSEHFWVDYLPETCKKTTVLDGAIGDPVNLEVALTPTTPLGGHIVSGHVDDTGTITAYTIDGDWHILRVRVDKAFAPFMIPKGSIAVDGIGLTLVDVSTTAFSCHIIPHTHRSTTLHHRQVGDRVNVEFDMMGKYLHRFFTLAQSN